MGDGAQRGPALVFKHLQVETKESESEKSDAESVTPKMGWVRVGKVHH